ncbi:CIA30 family protein [cf. Phormidesmis sp. LEGE 11477]|uniref:CIA30 family protein n=1 Tax=cf. Phormidesmis sp. LEGE 11477 TaxID=1828680 RepID=UPI00187DDEAC|nr:CIA30 family protein [cf. Phormidesmis sp. LEGE 11477]MBE9064800.1 CIA30 family protein [cf. Phormidesmis sp. LEGE 11477]
MKSNAVVIDFADSTNTNRWRSVDDTVMGGISQGSFAVSAAGTGVFSGELSLENNGGFSSVRRDVSDLDFSGVDAIALRVKGDGRRYQLRFNMGRSVNPDSRPVFYRAEFDTQPNQWQTVSLPLRSFEPVFRGRIVEDAPALSAERIQEIGLLLAGKQSGEFRLEIDWIEGG